MSTAKHRAKLISSAMRTAVVFVLVWLAGAVAFSHPVAQGAMEVAAGGRAVTINARVSAEEELIAATFGAGESALASTSAMRESHAAYLLRHVFVEADGHRLHGRVIPGGEGPGAGGSTEYKMEFPWLDGQAPRLIVVSQDVLNEFEFGPGNRWEATYLVRFVNMVGEGKAEAAVSLLSPREPVVFALGAGQGGDGGVRLARDYLLQGVWHILRGFDHLLFIAGLALAAVTLRDLVKVLSVFTLAHSVTLILSVLDILRVSSRIVEPMIAASIVFIAVQNFCDARASRGNGRLAIAFFFGLFHGLGFAGGLLDSMQGLGGLGVGLAIGAFSLGVECGHLGVVMPVFLVMHALRTIESRPAIPLGVMRAGSCMVAIAGAGYLIAACRA